MPEFCSCGTALVDAARFCHRCGKPAFEPAVSLEPVASETPPPLPAGYLPLEGLPVSFRNPIAVRVAFLMSVGIILIGMIPGLQIFLVIWWLAAGWGAVLLYRRLTGFALSVRAGARLGSITGVLIFLGLLIILAITMALTGKEVLDEMTKQDPRIATVINDPPVLVLGIVMLVGMMFAMVVGMCAAGGALGARFVQRSGAGNTPSV